MRTLILVIAAAYLALFLAYAIFQRKLIYYPTHHHQSYGLSEWRHHGRVIGYAREVPSPRNVWLLMHGNAGQASDRAYAIPSFSPHDSVFILEYPGYGSRPGLPSMGSINAAAREAYEVLRATFPKTPVCVVGESIGTGAASLLANNPHPPDKIVLITPFDTLSGVAKHHLPYLPASLILRDNWNNVKALRAYRGRVDIYGARDDDIIPVEHSRALAKSKPGAVFREIPGGHNDWASEGRVEIRNP